ncbi:type VII secretion protein EccCa [Corynebacterium sp. TAE3-ERU12]|uniref:type VII secretion protein EccCa n=1 Tax=Corynebacterium sp. TAE3-ERU12 TaxID=2849491 RepID=UPI001C48F2A1|nr:type VII secretion protein EccCa [Corynebacterium sp. TAE3-ERU12]
MAVSQQQHARLGEGERGADSGAAELRRPAPLSPQPPPLVDGEIRPEPPPEAPEPQRTPLVRILLPIVMLVGVGGMVAVMVVSGAARNPMTFLFPVLMVVSTVGMLAGGAQRGTDLSAIRRDYQRHLVSVRRAIVQAVNAQRTHMAHVHPDPGDLWSLTGTQRLWERRAGDDRFGQVRVGRGVMSPATPVVAPDIAAPDTLDPVGAVALRRIIRSSRSVPDLPIAVALPDFPVIAFAGAPADTREVANAVIAHLLTFHHPDDCAVSTWGGSEHWQWLKWAPHYHPLRPTKAGVELVRKGAAPQLTVVIVDGDADADALLSATLNRPGWVIIHTSASGGALWDAAIDRGLAITLADGRIIVATATGDEDIAAADTLGPASAEALARRLCGRHTTTDTDEGPRREPVLAELGLDPPPPQIDAPARLGRDRLRIPIGVTPEGSVVHLDMKEAAEGGVGPHGLCIGATGSGKSEILRTVVIALASTHPPEQLNFVLVDFKGGATFLGVEHLPHVSALITNLADELDLVDRMHDAITGEMTRRQEVLRAAGGFAGVAEYEAARRAGRTDLEPLPALVIVVDEFSELLGHRPEFAELFVAVGRLGRSLHMHLLLASQRLEEGRLRGLDSHLSYRIGLKTFSAAESRTVLGVPDAHTLPSQPGAGFLKTDADNPVRFRAAYVSGPPPVGVRPRGGGDADGTVGVVPFVLPTADTPDTTPAPPAPVAPGNAAKDDTTTLSAAVAAMQHYQDRAHQVWLPPLPDSVSLDELPADPNEAPLTATIGMIDNPLQQRQDPRIVDLRGAGGHVAVVGAPRSGKTTTLRTLMLAMARTTSADALEMHIVDYGAGGLADLQALPHVSSVAHRGDTDRITRTIAAIDARIAQRESHNRQNGWHSAAAARAAGVSDIVLVIDNFPALRTDHQDLADRVQRIIADGLAVGIHIAVSAHRWTELRPAIRDLLGTRLELRQAEAIDSIYDRKRARAVPQSPGRGLAEGGLAMLVAETTPSDSQQTAQACRDRGDQDVEQLRMLPEYVGLVEVRGHADVADVAETTAVVPIGLDEAALAPVFFRPDSDRHLIIVGSAGSGRTSTLRTVIAGLLEATPSVKCVVVDYRRGLLETVPADRLAGYAGSAAVAEPMIAELAQVLRDRLPGPDITPAQLAARDWWDGPEIAVVVDDYDLVSGFGRNPLAPLAECIAHAADIGLHLIIARRIGGAVRALHDQVLGGVRNQGAVALVLDGTREDGPIFGVNPDARPPGRGRWVAHGRPPVVVQVATDEPAAEEKS